jgi:hypothetical protein
MEISKGKILMKKILIFNFQLPTIPNSCKKECREVIQDSSMNNNTPTTTTQRREENNAKKKTTTQRTLYLK